MKPWKGIALGTLTAVLLTASSAAVSAAAAEDTEKVQQSAAADTAMQKDARATEKAAAKAAKKAEKRAKKEAAKREKAARYKTLFSDNGFTYYLDAQNSRWIQRPHRPDEPIIEAWIRLVEDTAGAQAAEDGRIRPTKYFLEHYYISPKNRQIMFLSELEVTGRPENAIKERPYDEANWEHLVPGSIEDELFTAVTTRMKHAPGRHGGVLSGIDGMSIRDMVEEFARISL